MNSVFGRQRVECIAGAVVCAVACCPNVSGVTVESGIRYAQATIHAHSAPETADLRLDVYRPDEIAGVNGNALVLIHGGGFTSGDRTSPDMVDAATYFSARGWVCFSIDYRLAPDDPPAPAWVEALGDPLLNAAYAGMVDTKRAIRWVRANAGAYACAPNRVAGLGHSAGAFCVVQACTTDEADYANDSGTPIPDLLPEHSGKLNAGVEVSGGTGLGTAEFDRDDAPLMIWHGEADQTVPFSQARLIHEVCVAEHIPCRFFTLAGLDHGAETWLGLYDGRNIKAHALDFLNVFFGAHITLAPTPGGVTVAWPSISDAVYRVDSTPALEQPFTSALPAAVTAAADTCTATVPGLPSVRFYRIGVLSGQL